MTWRVRIEVAETPARFVVVRAITECGQVFVELVKDVSKKESAVSDVRSYCQMCEWTVIS